MPLFVLKIKSIRISSLWIQCYVYLYFQLANAVELKMESPSYDNVRNVALSASLILTAEFFRRLLQFLKEMYQGFKTNSSNNSSTSNDLTLPKQLELHLKKISLWLDSKFVMIWLMALAFTIVIEKEKPSFAIIVPFILPCVIFISLYIFSHDTLMLSSAFIDNELTDGTNNIGPGLAVAWVSFIENTLLDEDGKDAKGVKEYKERQDIGSSQGVSEEYKTGYFITDRPVILLPDIVSYIQNYEPFLEAESGKWCCMLTKGIVEIDKMLRLRKGEREMICTLAQAMSYSYEVSGTKRSAEFNVVRWKDFRSSPNLPTLKYFRTIDNRPLDSMRKWYHDQKDHGVTLQELKIQFDLFMETLKKMLNEDERLRNKFYILDFSGPLSEELIDFEMVVRRNEKIPP